jgi:DNA-binding GntR family transcriptional regulator
MELTKLKRKRATDEVYEALRQAILGRTFKAGERLQVEEIAEKLGVSLTPVRHAIQQLATEGLIEIHPRSGTYVATLSAHDIEETFEIRCALECLAAEKAVARITDAKVARLRELLKLLSEPVATEHDLKRHEKHNLELHRIIIDTAGNKRLAEMYESLNAHIKIARIHGAEAVKNGFSGRLAEEQAEHEAIVEAIASRDSNRVVSAMRKHIYRAKDALINSLSDTE